MNQNKRFLRHAKKFLGLFLLAGLFISSASNAQDLTEGLKLHYNFQNVSGATVPDASGNGYSGTLVGATTGETNGKHSLILGKSNADYLDMGANTGNLIGSLNDFSIAVYIWVNETNTNLNANGNFIAVFANSENSGTDQNGIIFLQAKRSRYAISATYWNAEQYAQTGQDVVKGRWVHLAYTQEGTTGRLYENGLLKSTNAAITLRPSDIGATPYNFLGRPTYSGDLYLQDTQLADFRIYNRAISSTEVLQLNGYPAELVEAYNAIDLGDLTAVTSNINLPATAGSANIPVVWTSSVPATISETGAVTRPQQYDVTVRLTATVTMENNGVTYSLTKEFTAIVKAFTEMSEMIAHWNFEAEHISIENGVTTVTDATESGFVATLKNEARIRTIGETEQFNVLDLGNGTGYADLGAEIGKAVYALNNFAIMSYFYIAEENTSLGSNGNFLFNFGNTNDVMADRNGYIYGSLRSQGYRLTPTDWNAEQGPALNQQAPKGSWHHIAYVLNNGVGTVYVDGNQVATAPSMTRTPANTLPIAGVEGTLFNYLGRSSYAGDVYLRNTLLYDFMMFTVPITGDNLIFDFEVSSTLSRLNAAFVENPDFIDNSIVAEADALTLGDLSAVSANISLPTQGTTSQDITISWKSSHEMLISSTGEVNLPDYFDFPVTLTATIAKGAQMITKDFVATVVKKEGTAYANNLMVHYDFSNAEGRIVKDKSEKQFTGTTVNEASIRTIGNDVSGKFDVLDLGNGTGYFDMGEEMGKVMYHLNNVTISAFYRVHDDYTGLGTPGNFLWTISNSNNSGVDRNGYIIGTLNNQDVGITRGYWAADSGNESVSFMQPALKGSWHHLAFTLNDGIATIYVDGMAVIFADFINTPASALLKPNMLGTMFNWLGRSNYPADNYLRQTLVYDFRVYDKALSDVEILLTELKVAELLEELDAAYTAAPNEPSGLTPIADSPYSVYAKNGVIRLAGLSGNEAVALFDITGRQITTQLRNEYNVGAGVYIVRINNFATKVIVE